ncbi:MAG: 2-oxoglutarate dehydrogenase complex dihydrolipoyllysine-residue succinyltransferase, partial [Acidobacteria bacterium]|nr:2-oxoglutarate dehydrogenase complex dihydrolipoyllysine-residue succinyltransferase [Acidobacteriota bacterium]
MTNIVVPELGESVVEARVAKWLKSEGDRVNVGEPLVELETEKIDLEVSADRAGVLGSIKHAAGADVKVGEVLATLEEGGQDAPRDGSAQRTLGARGVASAQTAGVEPREDSPSTSAGPGSGSTKATPTAKNIARERNVDLGRVSGSGPGGRVTKEDVIRAGEAGRAGEADSSGEAGGAGGAGREATAARPSASINPPPPPAPPVLPAPPVRRSPQSGDRQEHRERMSKRRETIARRLVEAQHNAAMLTTFNEVDMTAVMSLRERRKEAFLKASGVGLGIASFFVKAAIGALKAFPQLNAEIQGNEIVSKHYYDIGMAVGAEGGLVVPVLRDADRLSFGELETAIREFAKRANNGSLTLEDLKGGTFTITNGGVFGSLMSTPILNPPQVGILGLHKIADRAVVVSGQVVIRPMMYLALSYDHRIVDG